MAVSLPEKLLALHGALTEAALAHAFGGALALAWCTQQARGTIDIDVNVFVPVDQLDNLLAALPTPIDVTDADALLLRRDGQARLWWDTTPVDVFLNTTGFHDEASRRIRWEPFAGESLPFLACRDLAVFKEVFNRTKDWADLEAMHAAGALDKPAVIGVLATHLEPDDDRIARIDAL